MFTITSIFKTERHHAHACKVIVEIYQDSQAFQDIFEKGSSFKVPRALNTILQIPLLGMDFIEQPAFLNHFMSFSGKGGISGKGKGAKGGGSVKTPHSQRQNTVLNQSSLPEGYVPPVAPPKTQIFVRHLPESMDESAVRNMFGKFGPIESVLFRGDGGALVFIRYQYPDSAQDAVNHMNRFTVPWPSGGPYTLKVEFARPKPLKFGKGSSGGGGKGKGRGGNYDEDWGEIAPPVPSSRYVRERSRSPYSGRWDESGKGKGKGKANGGGGGGGAPRGLKEATCLVHNIPEGTTWEHLKNFFSRAGFDTPTVKIGCAPDSYPVGVVSFYTTDDMLSAMRQLSNSTMPSATNLSTAASRVIYMEPDGMQRPTPGEFFKGIEQHIQKETGQPPSPANDPKQQQDEGGTTVYCGGLPIDVPAEQLSAMFTPFGRILRLDIKPPFYEWKGSYAFVLYEDAESATNAVNALDGLEMAGAPNGRITVQIQVQRKHWPGSKSH